MKENIDAPWIALAKSVANLKQPQIDDNASVVAYDFQPQNMWLPQQSAFGDLEFMDGGLLEENENLHMENK